MLETLLHIKVEVQTYIVNKSRNALRHTKSLCEWRQQMNLILWLKRVDIAEPMSPDKSNYVPRQLSGQKAFNAKW